GDQHHIVGDNGTLAQKLKLLESAGHPYANIFIAENLFAAKQHSLLREVLINNNIDVPI
ncbi:hypothetical protein ACJX0J_012839, partial [Zea mays]